MRTVATALLACSFAWATGCATPSRSAGSGDLLTDVADDGSLHAALDHEDPLVRRLAVRTLGRQPAGEAVPDVRERLAVEGDPEVLAAVCFALGQWRDAEAVRLLAPLVHHASPLVRTRAAGALGKLADDRRTLLVADALDDPDPTVRGAAALALFRLDGRRYDHVRHADDAALAARDEALLRVATSDAEAGVRWRAAYALAGVVARPGRAEALVACLEDPEPLVVMFALRGLGALPDAAAVARAEARTRLEGDERVAIEAARILAADPQADPLALTGHPSHDVRRLALEELTDRLARQAAEPAPAPLAFTVAELDRLRELASDDPSSTVRREALAALALARPDGEAFGTLATSGDPRDRERAARLLDVPSLADGTWLRRLADDEVPAVVAAALSTLTPEAAGPSDEHLDEGDLRRLDAWRLQIEDALASGDPAIVATAATVAAAPLAAGRAPPWLATAAADAMEQAEGFAMEEARIALAEALGLTDIDPLPPPEPPSRPLIDRVLEEHRRALEDPRPRVRLATVRGEVVLELDRVLAPRHVASFLELARTGFYDGLDVHRVVPNFVVQGLDPRGDGWGVGGRRLPDEFGARPFLSGTLGMPRVQRPHTGGCQIFVTHVPTPHLDGAYTVFGAVVEGMDVVTALQIGDVVEQVRRVR